MANFNVSLKKLTEKVSLDVVYTPKGLEEINVEIAEVNRPGLFLAGYYDYFDKLRLQILGLAEMNFFPVFLPRNGTSGWTSCSASSLRLSLSAAVRNWNHFLRCWNWLRSTGWPCSAPTR